MHPPYSTLTPTRIYDYAAALAAEPKHWMSVTAPLWAWLRLSPACLIKFPPEWKPTEKQKPRGPKRRSRLATISVALYPSPS